MYIPVMKNRTVEVSVIQQLSLLHVFDQNVIPLIELIQERTRSNNKASFIEQLCGILDDAPQMRVMVDFFKSTKLRSTTDAIREYITLSVRQPDFCYQELAPLAVYSERVIPVVSYLSDSLSIERIQSDAIEYRKSFSHIAFRLKIQDFENVFSCVESIISEHDYLILDIESASHMSAVFKKVYKRISDCKKERRFTSIVIRSHRPDNLINKEMSDGEPIAEIDNSLKELYNAPFMNRFDGFGDYACISSALPSTGGVISPVGIFYSDENNFFVSYKGRASQLSEFPMYIAPRIIASEYWNEYSEEHRQTCPGCREIMAISTGEKSGRNQAQWKMITMLHYIFTMFTTEA